MAGPVNHGLCHKELWRQSTKWPGSILIQWVSVKDIPNHQFIHIENPLNENKPACQGRDCQELFPKAGERMLAIFKTFVSTSKLFENFIFYDEQERFRRLKERGFVKKVVHQQKEKVFYDSFGGGPPLGKLPYGPHRPDHKEAITQGPAIPNADMA